ncbi:MAG: hypothetical protein V4664_01260 [Patescibacteria group bacterium]
MEFEFSGVTLLKSESKAYEINGKKGVSNKAYVLVGSDVFKCKVNDSLYAEIKDVVKEDGNAKFYLSTYNGVPSLALLAFS